MKKTLILVADMAHARLFSAETRTSNLDELETLVHPEGRQHEQALTSDLPGRQMDRSNAGRHSVGDKGDIKKQEAIDFARHISHHLEEAHNKKGYRELIVVAAPSFLGLLRTHMNHTISKLVSWELPKNLVKQDVKSIRQHLPDILPRLSTT
ncbi:MAG: host attachment protein [Gammaproteobacteria bacterium]|nr:host attachment protein [Gammaproteobacteria bacterium]